LRYFETPIADIAADLNVSEGAAKQASQPLAIDKLRSAWSVGGRRASHRRLGGMTACSRRCSVITTDRGLTTAACCFAGRWQAAEPQHRLTISKGAMHLMPMGPS
jgi:hypothetical protein